MIGKKKTKQISHWAGTEGNAYVDRNPKNTKQLERLYRKDYDVSRGSMDEDFLKTIRKDTSILEVGANVGTQLQLLREQGFSKLLGVDINRHAIKEAKRLRPDVDIFEASGFDLPFKDGAFDLVYTSGVLIHISPKDVKEIMREMHRVSGKYIWGFEYYAPKCTEVTYRGKKNLLWKTDFSALFLKEFPDLKVVKEKIYPMTDGVNATKMYLLKKVH